ncbi:MAG: phosphatase PAP2 family protein [Candidatus Methanoperedens sp.]|nr:phosphatase PAP2 family protein [Candidatus Methanoperedens sp.]
MSVPVQILFSENINIFLQSFGTPLLDKLFIAITNSGSHPVYFILASIIFWCFSKKIGIRAMYVILFSAFLAIYLKNIFTMPRPPEHLHKVPADGFGFPSAHAQVSAGFWGYLGGITRNQKMILIGAAAVILVSLSRVYLGVHYAGDVIAGIFFGLLIVMAFLKAESYIIKWKISRVKKYCMAVMFPSVLMILAAAFGITLEQLIELWLVIVFTGAGYLMEEELVGLKETKNNRQRIKRAFTGVLLAGFVYLMFYPFSNLVFYDGIRYASLGFTTTFVAPWLFVKIETGTYSEYKH